MKLAIRVLWPSFLVAAAGNALFFTAFDPAELHALWEPLPASRLGAYTFGFFAFWALGACSSVLTCFLQRTAEEVNRALCPLPHERRPPGCRGEYP